MKALILAAGYSTRLYPLTLNTPKALLPIGKKAMIDYLIEKIAALGAVKETIFVTNARFYKDFSDWAEGANERYAPMRFTVVSDGTSDDAGKLGAVGDIAYAVREAKIDDDLLVAASR